MANSDRGGRRGGSRRAALIVAILAGSCLVAGGCGRPGRPRVGVAGAVRVGGQPAERGFVRFVPLDASETAAQVVHMVAIVDGRYAVQTGGGLVPGDYRVEAAAERLTGRLVPALHEGAPLPERQPVSDPTHAGPKSPLRFTAVAGRPATFDIDLPAVAPAK